MKTYMIKFKPAKEPAPSGRLVLEHIKGAIDAVDPDAIYFAPDTCVVKTTMGETDIKT
jgi:hypothetical protein